MNHLDRLGIRARAEGGGVHWHVEVEPVGARSVRIHVFWYERAVGALMLGMNPGNARIRRPPATEAPAEGAEYLVILRQDSVEVADGRTRVENEAIASAERWLAGATLDDLSREVPFVDEKPRAMRDVAARLDPELRREIGGGPTHELWVYAGDRTCEFRLSDDDVISCIFLLGQAQIACAPSLDDVPRAVESWLVDRVPIAALATRVPSAELEPHTELLERDPARWHWQHVLERVASPNDVLAPMRELIEELSRSPVASSFYSFSSLNRFCFSASSHYPWVNDGLPVIAPGPDSDYFLGSYWATDERCDRRTTIERVEAALSAYRIRPFFGSAPHHELPFLADCLARHGSRLQAQIVHHGRWPELEVVSEGRRSTVSSHQVTFDDGVNELCATWPSLDGAVGAIVQFLEQDASLDLVGAREHATISRRGPRS